MNKLIELTADVVGAYVSSNTIPASELPKFISTINAALAKLGGPPPAPDLVPAVDPKKSIKPDYIICLEDGKRFRSMKRHLGLLGMTPDEYRAKWGLPRDYPMVAPNYASARSELAKSMGLGRKSGTKVKSKVHTKQNSPASAQAGRRT